MEKQYYFPPLNGAVDCSQCKVTDCWCREKYQRNRRDFTHTSGRCPRLPDLRGFVEQEERDAYAAAFPLIHAELGAEDLHLTLTMPGQKQAKKVYQTKSGYWYFKVKHKDGYPVKPILEIPGFWDKEQIIRHMEELHTDYCILRCKLADFYA